MEKINEERENWQERQIKKRQSSKATRVNRRRQGLRRGKHRATQPRSA